MFLLITDWFECSGELVIYNTTFETNQRAV